MLLLGCFVSQTDSTSSRGSDLCEPGTDGEPLLCQPPREDTGLLARGEGV